jgi:hypothetical protein
VQHRPLIHAHASVQDWLAHHHLDRAALTKLKDNWEGFRAWEAWVAAHASSGDEGEPAPRMPGNAAEAAGCDAGAGAATAAAAAGLDGAAGGGSATDAAHTAADGSGALDATDTAADGSGAMDVDGSTEDALAEVREDTAQGSEATARVGVEPVMNGQAQETQGGKDEASGAPSPAAEGQSAAKEAKEKEEPAAQRDATADIVTRPSGVWRARAHTLTPLGSEFGRFSYEFGAAVAIGALQAGQGALPDAADPLAVLGRALRLFWPADAAWYSADVVGWRPATRRHTVLYHDDDEEEELCLAEEEAAGRLQWLPGTSSADWVRVAPPRARSAAGAAAAAAAQTTTPAAALFASQATAAAPDAPPSAAKPSVERPSMTETGEPIPMGAAGAGWRVEVFWEDTDTWFKGIVDSYDTSVERHRVVFDDGEHQWVDFGLYPVRWVKPDAREEAATARAEAATAARETAAKALAAAQAEAAERAQHAPEQVRVVCNGHHACLLVKDTTIVTDGGERMSPTEFERMSGKGAAKKWKVRRHTPATRCTALCCLHAGLTRAPCRGASAWRMRMARRGRRLATGW